MKKEELVKKSKVIFKKPFLLPLFNILLILSLLFVLPGCNSDGTKFPDSTTQPSPTEPPYYISFDFSPVPDLVNPGELTVTFDVNTPNPQDLSNARMELEFYWTNTQGSYSEAIRSVLVPIDEVLVCGDTIWEGNASSKDSVSLHNQIILPREGVWKIWGIFYNNDERIWSDYIKVAVGEGTSAVMYTEEFYASPLAYLANLYYGEGGEKRFDEMNPVVIDLDISKPPRVGEEAVITYRIRSLYEVADFSTQFLVYKRTEGVAQERVPVENIITGADLAWEGDLKPGEPVVVTTMVVFPEAGDWRIGVYGDIPDSNFTPADKIQLNVTDVRGSYGWEERRTRSTLTPGASQILETGPAINWWIIGGIIAAVIIVGSITTIMIIRRRRGY
jgi:hypothetical protein